MKGRYRSLSCLSGRCERGNLSFTVQCSSGFLFVQLIISLNIYIKKRNLHNVGFLFFKLYFYCFFFLSKHFSFLLDYSSKSIASIQRLASYTASIISIVSKVLKHCALVMTSDGSFARAPGMLSGHHWYLGMQCQSWRSSYRWLVTVSAIKRIWWNS